MQGFPQPEEFSPLLRDLLVAYSERQCIPESIPQFAKDHAQGLCTEVRLSNDMVIVPLKI